MEGLNKVIIWKGLKYRGIDYSNKFRISNLGELQNIKTNTTYKKRKTEFGYHTVTVSLGSRKHKLVINIHRAVAETFIPNPNNKTEVNHKDGNKLNNSVENLEWCTHRENMIHASKNGLLHPATGISQGFSRLSQVDVLYIKNNYISGDKQFGSRGLARKFNCSHMVILNIIKGKTYKEI